MQGEPSHRGGGPIVGDAFGRLLLDCFETPVERGRFAQIIERDDGFIEAGDPSIYFQAAPRSEQEALAIGQAKGRVLDIGAGAGRHSLRLQARGLDVVALDVSPLAIEVCKRREVQQVFAGSIEDLAATNAAPFDTFLLAGGNLGLLRDRQYASRFLETLGEMARPGAVIIGSGIDPYRTDNKDHLEYHAANRAAGRMAGQVTIRVRHRRWATEWFGLLWTSISELEALLQSTAWALEDVIGEGSAYHVVLRRR